MTPETNRIQTNAPKIIDDGRYGYAVTCDGFPKQIFDTVQNAAEYFAEIIAKPAPVTQDVVPWEAIMSSLVEAMETARDYVSDAACGYVWNQGQSGSPLVKLDTKMPKEDIAIIDKALKAVCDSLQHRPQPATTEAFNAELLDLLPFLQTADLASEPQLRGLCKSLARIIEAAAVAAAKRMTGGV